MNIRRYDKGMKADVLVSASEYLSTSYRPDREFIDGAVVERRLGERDHSALQMGLSAYLYNRRRELGIHVYPEQRVQVAPTRFRVPDISVVVGPQPREMILTRPPFLCIEILSKDDRPREMKERVKDYLEFGVGFVWVIDPRRRRAWVHSIDGSYEIRDEVLRTAEPEIVVPLAEFFAEL